MISAVLYWQRMKFPWTLETLLLVLFGLWMSFTTMFALSPLAVDEWGDVMKILISILLTLLLISDPRHLRWLIWVITLSLGFYGFKGGLFTILTGGGNHVVGPENTYIEDNNALALTLTMTLPLFRYLQLTSNERRVRWALGIGMGVITVALLGTYSRGGLVALAVTAILLLIRGRRKFLFATLGIILAAGALSLMPSEWFKRMQTIESYDEDPSAIGRFTAWHFAVLLADERPLTGGGFQAFTSTVYQHYAPEIPVRDAHSIYFKILGEHGYPGLAIFLALGLSALISATRIKGAVRGHPDLVWANDLATMSQIGLIAYGVGGSLLGMTYFDLPYHLVSFIVLTKVFIRRKFTQDRYELAQTEHTDQEVSLTPSGALAPTST
jgi:probable O-glycosylation ligase (exosortase A-associated)